MTTGGPAFPVEGPFGSTGITVRDYFAAKAMQSMLAAVLQRSSASAARDAPHMADGAYAVADAMIRASGRREE